MRPPPSRVLFLTAALYCLVQGSVRATQHPPARRCDHPLCSGDSITTGVPSARATHRQKRRPDPVGTTAAGQRLALAAADRIDPSVLRWILAKLELPPGEATAHDHKTSLSGQVNTIQRLRQLLARMGSVEAKSRNMQGEVDGEGGRAERMQVLRNISRVTGSTSNRVVQGASSGVDQEESSQRQKLLAFRGSVPVALPVRGKKPAAPPPTKDDVTSPGDGSKLNQQILGDIILSCCAAAGNNGDTSSNDKLLNAGDDKNAEESFATANDQQVRRCFETLNQHDMGTSTGCHHRASRNSSTSLPTKKRRVRTIQDLRELLEAMTLRRGGDPSELNHEIVTLPPHILQQILAAFDKVEEVAYTFMDNK